jgi:hypothetical protein
VQQGAVTFLDVLGWKGIWTRQDDAIDKLKALIAAARGSIATAIELGAQHIDDLRGFDERAVRVESISDTIVLSTPGAANAMLWLHGAICQVAICASIDSDIPVRGATCYGEYETDDRIMVGPAIDEAASWHESTDWIGVVQTPTAYMSYSDVVGLPRVWASDTAPLKAGRLETYCVDWSRHWRETLGRGEVELKVAFTRMRPLDTSIAAKYLNALSFYQKQTSAAGEPE